MAIPTSPVAPNTSGSGRFDLASRLPTPRRNPIARAIQLSIPRRDPIARAITLSTLARESITRPITLSTLANESIISYRNYQFRTLFKPGSGTTVFDNIIDYLLLLSIFCFNYRFSDNNYQLSMPKCTIKFIDFLYKLSIFCKNYQLPTKRLSTLCWEYGSCKKQLSALFWEYESCCGKLSVSF